MWQAFAGIAAAARFAADLPRGHSEWHGASIAGNAATWYLCGVGCDPRAMDVRAALAPAKRHLSAARFVGVTEHLADFLHDLGGALGGLSLSVQHMNRSPRYNRARPASELSGGGGGGR